MHKYINNAKCTDTNRRQTKDRFFCCFFLQTTDKNILNPTLMPAKENNDET